MEQGESTEKVQTLSSKVRMGVHAGTRIWRNWSFNKKRRYLRRLLQLYWGRPEEGALLVPLSLPVSGPALPPAWLSFQHEVRPYSGQLELSLQQCLPTDYRVLGVLWLGLLKTEEEGPKPKDGLCTNQCFFHPTLPHPTPFFLSIYISLAGLEFTV